MGREVHRPARPDLRIEFRGVKGFSSYGLKYMHAFAATWQDGTELCKAALHNSVQAGLGQISPYHHVALLDMLDKLDDPELRVWYEGSGPPHIKFCHLVFGSRDAQRSLVVIGAARYDQAMSGVPADLPPGSAVVLTNPDEDASPEAFRAFIDELLAGPEPELESVDAAAALRALRVDAQA